MLKAKASSVPISENESLMISGIVSDEPLLPSKQAGGCQCALKIEKMESKLEMLGLRMEEVASNLNISFTKHMDTYGKIIEEQKQRENIEYTIWQMKEDNKGLVDRVTRDLDRQKKGGDELGEEVQKWARLLRELKSWKNVQVDKSAQLEKEVYEGMKGHKKEVDEKMKKMYEVVQEIGLLQRKMLEGKENNWERKENNWERVRGRNMSTVEPRVSLPVKRSSLVNESTILGTSCNNYYN